MVDKMELSSATRRLSNQHALIQPQRSKKDTKNNMRADLQRVKRLGVEPIRYKTCTPQGETESRLHEIIARIEPGLRAMAATEEGWEFFVILTDKSRQNPLNMLGGYESAGDASIEAYWEAVGQAASMIAGLFDSPMQLEFLRVSNSSDEGVLVIAGKNLSRELKDRYGEKATIHDIFEEAWNIARDNIDLSEKTYQLVMPWSGHIVERNLRSFSRGLRHQDMVVACNYSVSEPVPIRPNSEGFIGDEIRKLENDEVPFYNDLPLSFIIPGTGMTEVLSPFSDNLSLMAERDPNLKRMSSGYFVDIRCKAHERDAMALLPFTTDWNGFKGTRKGFAGIYSGYMDMSMFNTILGKAKSNSILTPTAQGMGNDLGWRYPVMPYTGGYLRYYMGHPGEMHIVKQQVQKVLENRLHSDRVGDPCYINIGLDVDVRIMDATSVDIKDVRAKFILQSLGRMDSPAWLLNGTDFVPNFVENVHPDLQKDIKKELRISDVDARNLDAVERICSRRRTIRDAEDLVWVLRKDVELPEDIRNEKASIENWLFDFAKRSYHRMFELLNRVQ